MDTLSSVASVLVYIVLAIVFLCGIYMLFTKKVLLSYLTIGAGKFTEESKEAFSTLGGIGIVVASPAIVVFELGINKFDNFPMIVIGAVLSIVGLIIFLRGRKKLVRE